LVSAYPIVAVDLHDAKLQLARNLGATHVINAKRENVEQVIAAIAGAEGVDCFVDNTGVPAVIETGYRLTKPQGRVVMVGVPKKGSEVTIHSLPLHFGKGFSAPTRGSNSPSWIFLATKIYTVRADQAARADHRSFPLEDINTAIDRMRTGAIRGRCLVRMQA